MKQLRRGAAFLTALALLCTLALPAAAAADAEPTKDDVVAAARALLEGGMPPSAAAKQAAAGTPWTATYFQSKGDPITDLHEDMAAEQKARTTYDNILRLIKDPEICDPIRFLREREIVHYQRFGESLRIVQDRLDSKNFYAFNPEFDNRRSGKCCD